MQNPIKLIYDFNHKAGLVEKGYDDFLESSFQVEEALEGFGVPNEVLIGEDGQAVVDSTTAKDLSRDIVGWVQCSHNNKLSDVDRLDKACDAVVFAIGSMTKLGLNPQQITAALNVVMQANLAKLSCPKDEYGKLTKPADFDEKYAPEPKLQAILDQRS